MATDPSQLLAMLSQNSGNFGQYLQAGQEAALKGQQDQQNIALNAAKLQQVQQQAASDAAFQSDWADYLRNPTTDKLAQIAVKYPSHADAVKEFWSIKDPEARQSHITAIAQPLAALQNGKVDLALTALQNIREAAFKAGEPTDDLDGEIDSLKSGDPSSINSVKGTLMMHLAAADPDGKFAESLSKAQKALSGGDPYTLAPGDVRYDGNNTVVARGGPKVSEPHYEKIDVFDKYGTKVGERVIQVGGGDGSASGADPSVAGAPSTGSTVTGQPLSVRLNNPGAIRADPANDWQGQVGQKNGFVQFDTPANGLRAHRILIANQIKAGYDTPLTWAQHYAPASDGNDPQAYAASIANGLGIGVNDKMTLGMVPKVAALSARVEAGGTPTRGAPQGNPAQQAGGGTVVYDSTSGQPTESFDPTTQIKAGDPSTVPSDIRSTVKAIVSGQMAQPSSFALTKPYWQNVMAAAAALDPSYDSSKQPQRVAAAKAFTGNGKAAQVLASIDRLSYHLNDLYRDSQALTGWNLGPASGMFNSGVQSFQRASLARYNAALPFIAGELQKLTKNGSATEGESKQIMSNLAPSQPASARLAAMQQLAELTQGQFKPIRDQWSAAFDDGRAMPMDVSPEANAILDNLSDDKGPVAIDPHTGRLAQTGGARRSGTLSPTSAAPVKISGDADYARLPSGARFIGPDGQIRRKP